MKRYSFVLKVKKERIAEYKATHREVWPEMLEALKRNGIHNHSLFLREDGTFCLAHTRFVMLHEGKIIFEGPDEILRESDDPYIQRFLA